MRGGGWGFDILTLMRSTKMGMCFFKTYNIKYELQMNNLKLSIVTSWWYPLLKFGTKYGLLKVPGLQF